MIVDQDPVALRKTMVRVAAKLSDHGRVVEPDDLAHDALVSLLERVPTYDPRRASFYTYSYRRARGAMIDSLRSWHHTLRDRHDPARTPVPLTDDLVDGVCDGGPTPLRRTLAAELLRLATRLPAREAHIIRRVYRDDWLLKEVAAELGIADCRASQLHKAALQTLKVWAQWTSAPACGSPSRISSTCSA